MMKCRRLISNYRSRNSLFELLHFRDATKISITSFFWSCTSLSLFLSTYSTHPAKWTLNSPIAVITSLMKLRLRHTFHKKSLQLNSQLPSVVAFKIQAETDMEHQKAEGCSSIPARKKLRFIKLKKEVGLLEAVAITVGSIIGSGIFVSPKGVVDNCGSVGLALVVWTLSGVMAAIGSLCYAELGTSLPGSGGDYHYLHEAFGPLPAFMFLWVYNLIFLPATNAILALTFAQYSFAAFFPLGCAIPPFAIQLMAASAILFFTWINCYSIRLTTKIQNVFMFGKLAALLMIIIVGMVTLCKGHTGNYQDPWKDTTTDPGKIALAFYSGTFAYSGWNTLNYVTEELKNPSKNLPRAIYISVPIVTAIYVLTNSAYFAILSPEDIKLSQAVAVTFGEKAFGVIKFIIPVFVAMSSVGGLSIHIMAASRILFVGARNGHFPRMFSFIQLERLSPTLSLIFMAILSLIYLCIPDVFFLINFSTFIFSVTCFSVVIAMLYLRWKSPNLTRPIKISLFYPIAFACICIFLMVFPILVRPATILTAIGILATSLPVYLLFISLQRFHPKYFGALMAGLTHLIQKTFMSVAQDKSVHLTDTRKSVRQQ